MTKRRLKSHFPPGVNNSLGKSLLNQTKTKSTSNEKQLNSQNAGKFDSRTHESSVQEILMNYQLANKNFEAERSDLKIISSKGDSSLLEGLEDQNLEELHSKYGHLLRIPRRPKPGTYQSAEELDALETSHFLDWRRKLAKLSEGSKIVITPFERNLEVWRQLWRVVERSDVIVQIVDARNPLLFRNIDLENFVKEVDPLKKNLLLINKADLLNADQIVCWKRYFKERDILAIFWSNRQIVDLNIKELSESEYPNKDTESSEESDEDVEELDEEENVEESEDEEEDLLNESTEECETPITEIFPQIEDSDKDFVESPSELLQIFESFAGSTSPKAKDQVIVIGMVGYPNVGKSSTINRLIGTKKIAVSSTPGKTKHFQTLVANEKITLCDCPGLVMPSFGLSNSEMILNGILPIAHMQDYYSPISLLCNRIPRHVLQRHYSILLPKKEPVQAHDFLTTVAFLKGYMSSSGIPDCSRSARLILREAVQGTLRWCIAPPGISQEQFDNWTYKEFIENSAGKEIGKNLLEQMQRRDLLLDINCENEEFNKTLTKKSQVGTRIEKEFFPQMEDVKKGVATMRLKGESLIGEEKRTKKHFNKNKRQKLRRIFVSTSYV
uniref:Large subunit GTPase 1 homolog n=1 Tax=Meloidogyne hapla TaxID=6305 RepID=A0A1I8B039_MELHA